MKSWFFAKINKIDKSLARRTKEKREDSNKIRNEREVIMNTKKYKGS